MTGTIPLLEKKKKTKKTVKAPVENETDNMDSDDLGEEMEEEQRLNFFATQSSSPKMSKRLSVVETLVIQEESQEIELKTLLTLVTAGTFLPRLWRTPWPCRKKRAVSL